MATIICNAVDSEISPQLMTSTEIEYHLKCVTMAVTTTRSARNMFIETTLGKLKPDNDYSFQLDIDTISNVVDSVSHDLIPNELENKYKQYLSQELISSLTKNILTTKTSTFKATRAATNRAEFDNFYISGVKSVFKHLPFPRAKRTTDGNFAYICLRELTATFAAFGIEPFQNNKEHSNDCIEEYYESRKGKAKLSDLQKKFKNILGPLVNDVQCKEQSIKEWCDFAEKNNTRTNKDSFYVHTLTFISQKGNGNIIRYQYIIAIALKRDAEKEFIPYNSLTREFNKCIKDLNTPHKLYNGKLKLQYYGTFNLAATVADGPARREMTFTGLHNHSFGRRFGYAAFISLKVPIISCQNCYNKRRKTLLLRSTTASSNCQKCLDYNYFHPNMKKYTTFDNLKNFKYPKVMARGGPVEPVGREIKNTNLISIKLTYNWQITAFKFAIYHLHSRNYLLNLNNTRKRKRDFSDEDNNEKIILTGAVNSKNVGWESGEYRSYLRACNMSKKIVQCGKLFSENHLDKAPRILMEHHLDEIIPEKWKRNGTSFDENLDAIFHLLFHGIVPLVINVFLDLLKQIKFVHEFMPMVNAFLNHIHQLQISSYLVEKFGITKDSYSYAGWIGSTKYYFLKVMPHLMSTLRMEYQCFKINKTKNDVKKDLLNFQKIDKMEVCVNSLICLVSTIMKRNYYKDDIEMVDTVSKLFISDLTFVEKIMGYQPDKLSYIVTGNILCLLNISKQMNDFGPLRNFYDAIDEKAVQQVKKHIRFQNMVGNDTMVSVLNKINGIQCLEQINHLYELNIDERDFSVQHFPDINFF